MSHDNWCSDCGERGGIAYGYCEACTPRVVLEEIKRVENLIKGLIHDYGTIGAPQLSGFKGLVKEWRKLWRDPKRDPGLIW